MDNNFFIFAPSEDALFIRIVTSNDYLLLFALLFILFDNKINIHYQPYVKNLALFTILIVLILTFTRYIWFLMIIILLIKLLLSRSTFACIFFFVFTCIFFLFFMKFSDQILLRLFDHSSLDAKFKQSILLYDQFSTNPFWGSGIGSYIDNYFRSSTLYLYENQFLSLFMQFGIIGGLILFSFFIFPFYKVFLNPAEISKLSSHNILVLIYVLFLFSSLANPNLFLLNISIVYFILYLYTNKYQKN